MTRPLLHFWRRPLSEKWLFTQAYFLLGLSRAAILIFSFKRLAGRMGRHMEETPLEISEEEMNGSRRISWAVCRASRLTPWNSNCFAQALTAQYLLQRNNIPSTLYFGAKMDDEKALKAHAWIRCGRHIITGREGHRQYGVVSTFAKR